MNLNKINSRNEKEIKEIIDALQNINTDIYFDDCLDKRMYIKLETNGFIYNILLGSMLIWSSGDDNREFNEDTQEYKPSLEIFIKQQLKCKINEFNQIKELL